MKSVGAPMILGMLWLGMTGVAYSQGAQPMGEQKQQPVSAAVRSFLTEAAKSGLTEVELGKMALDRASSQEVKDFARRMVVDHSEINVTVMGRAGGMGVNLPQQPESAPIQKLQGMSGSKFDQEYITMMVNELQKDIQEWEKNSQNTDNPEIRLMTSRVLPILRDHLAAAEQLQEQLAPAKKQQETRKSKGGK